MRAASALASALTLVLACSAAAQPVTNRGYAEGLLRLYPQAAPNDPQHTIADVLVRDELFVRPAEWLQLAAGVDLRANSHDQVDVRWRVDWSDRGTRRPAIAVRRLAATVTRGRLNLDLGKQFIRWGTTDIITPTDRFAPRDFLNVITAEFLPVTGARASYGIGAETLEGVWVPRLTPSRVPLFDQRWTVFPREAAGVAIVDQGLDIPEGAQFGARWRHAGSITEFALSYFSGFNHLPNIASSVAPAAAAIVLTREFPPIRAVGAEAAMPTRWFTVKAEAEYFAARDTEGIDSDAPTLQTVTSPGQAGGDRSDNYVLYVVQLERQSGEWVFVGGYAGEIVTKSLGVPVFAPDRGLARSFVGRASYTIDPRRSASIEGTFRRGGDGVYAKAEYTEARGQHWRATIGAVVIAGHTDDFLGQYRRNRHLSAALRYSF